MDIEFCCNKCGRGTRPTRLVWMRDSGTWRLMMETRFSNDSFDHECNFIEVDGAQELLEKPPHDCSVHCGELVFYENADVDRILWDVQLKDKSCPYLAEHMMSDIRHRDRMEEWRRREERRKELVRRRKNGEERMKAAGEDRHG